MRPQDEHSATNNVSTGAHSPVDYVFGYGSLVALRELAVAPALQGRLVGFRRLWGAAMDNWDAVNDPKHWIDAQTRQRPRIRVAYLDIEPSEEGSVNGLAIPVDAPGLALIDAREVNYARVDVSDAFEALPPPTEDSGPAERAPTGPGHPRRVFAYLATDAARGRCRAGAAESDICVSAEYVTRVRDAFAGLGDDALAEFDRTTEPLPFPERDLEMVLRP